MKSSFFCSDTKFSLRPLTVGPGGMLIWPSLGLRPLSHLRWDDPPKSQERLSPGARHLGRSWAPGPTSKAALESLFRLCFSVSIRAGDVEWPPRLRACGSSVPSLNLESVRPHPCPGRKHLGGHEGGRTSAGAGWGHGLGAGPAGLPHPPGLCPALETETGRLRGLSRLRAQGWAWEGPKHCSGFCAGTLAPHVGSEPRNAY